MSTNPRRPLDNENGYEQRPAQYPHPSVPPQARQGPGPVRQMSRPTIHQPQPQMGLERQQSRPDLYSQRPRQEQYAEQQQPVLQRQRSRPDQSYPGQPLQRPQQPPYQDTTLQRQPSRPDQQQQQLPRTLQRRPDQYYSEPAPSQPVPMADPSYQYKALPVQPLEPALMRAPSAPTSQFSRAESDTTTLAPPIRPYAETMLIRSNSDDDLDKNDVFWRRFNASAVQQQLPDAEKSSWLEKTEGKSSRHTRTLWIVGFIFVIVRPLSFFFMLLHYH
ncbi:hypothetical protein B0H19DRAFT_1108769 [Mycena capillaripes]|nr:hypothetical protein B0H19DRAFT_1108769 [Mycena capillaripes]